MTVVAPELCVELLELSGWNGVAMGWFDIDSDNHWRLVHYDGEIDVAPAYDLGYILQAIVDHSSLEPAGVLRMLADYITEGESFADAACRLAVRLFEDGILEKAA